MSKPHISPHIPVMLNEVLEALSPKDGGIYLDGTFGAGGYTKAILDHADCTVIAIDRDLGAASFAQNLKEEYGDRFVFVPGCFGDALDHVSHAGFEKIDGFVLDLGVSSIQLDQAERGFSFSSDGPLDMRMEGGGNRETAADLVNTRSESEIADILYLYGEERKSRKIAAKIVTQRTEAPFVSTKQLADLIRSVVPKSPKDKIDPATRSFQALRIAVNDELGELERGLGAAEHLLKEEGVLVVVSFHSLEDRIVKTFMRERAGLDQNLSRYLPDQEKEECWSFHLPHKKAIFPTEKESKENSRSRSARMRVAVRTAFPPVTQEQKAKQRGGRL